MLLETSGRAPIHWFQQKKPINIREDERQINSDDYYSNDDQGILVYFCFLTITFILIIMFTYNINYKVIDINNQSNYSKVSIKIQRPRVNIDRTIAPSKILWDKV